MACVLQRSFSAACLLAFSLSLSACSGGGGGSATPPAEAVATPVPASTPAPTAQTTAALSGNGSTAALPTIGGIGGSVTFPAASLSGPTIATITESQSAPSGGTTLSGKLRRKQSVSASAAVAYLTITTNGTAAFTVGGPRFAFTLPLIAAASNYYVALYDPTAATPTYDDLYQVASVINGTSVTFRVGNVTSNTYTLAAGKQYVYALYVLPGITADVEGTDMSMAPAPCGSPSCINVGYFNDDLNTYEAIDDANGFAVPLPTAPTASSSNQAIFTTGSVTTNATAPGPYFAEVFSKQTLGAATLNVVFPVGGLTGSATIAVYNQLTMSCGSAFSFSSGGPVATAVASSDLNMNCTTAPATYNFPYGVYVYPTAAQLLNTISNASVFTAQSTALYATQCNTLSREPGGNICDAYVVLFKTSTGAFVKWKPNASGTSPGIIGPEAASAADGTFAF